MSISRDFPPLVIGDLTLSLPIIQGGMGVAISMSGLASAVANEGGIGVIATAGIGFNNPEFGSDYREANLAALRCEIRKARTATAGVLGVNILAALTNHEELARTAMAEGIDLIISGAGLPMNLPAYRPVGCRTKLIPIVSSARAATVIARRWRERFDYIPDAIIVEGPLAGGHLGFKPEQIGEPAYALEKLVPEVLAVVRELEQRHQRRIPVIAAGGIYTGADIRRFLALGASGVQMATRFVTTCECDASDAFKQAYINAGEKDAVIIKSPVGMPGRALRNQFTDDVEKGMKKPYKCSFHCISACDQENSPYCIAYALLSARRGDFKHGFAFAGANAWRATEIVSVKDLVCTLREEYRQSAP